MKKQLGLEIFQLPALSDNFIYVLHDPVESKTAVVDPAEAEPVLRFLAEKSWPLDFILNTHHHRDHVGANLPLKEKTNCVVVGSKRDAKRIPGIDVQLSEGEKFFLGTQKAKIFSVDGHTIGHIAYWFPESSALFSGDVIFSLGSGKLFEGSAEQMWNSLCKLRALPEETMIYGAHEYTLDNARYALMIEPGNLDLQKHVVWARARREKNLFTVPTSMGTEKKINPFLRPESAEIQRNLQIAGKNLAEILGCIRANKDEFDQRR